MTKLLTVKEAAEILHMHPSSIYDLVDWKLLTHRRYGRAIRFTEDDLLEAHKVEAAKRPRGWRR